MRQMLEAGRCARLHRGREVPGPVPQVLHRRRQDVRVQEWRLRQREAQLGSGEATKAESVPNRCATRAGHSVRHCATRAAHLRLWATLDGRP